MAERMTVAVLAKSIAALSERIDGRFDDVDRRFEDVDRRFDDVHRRFDQMRVDLEKFSEDIKLHFKVALEGMDQKLDAALDRTAHQELRLDAFDKRNETEHRLMRTQIAELDVELQRRRPRRR